VAPLAVPLPDAAATRALGERLGRACFDGAVLLLTGPLGSGKTTLCQGLAHGLGVAEAVVSPTFILLAEHQGRLPLVHADLYRVQPADLPGLALDERVGDGVWAVEWPDRAPRAWPGDHLEVELEDAASGRVARVRATGPRHHALAEAARA
jgi:tRNA threonylcarbamoyladenosine biosynthesis protein TsaE